MIQEDLRLLRQHPILIVASDQTLFAIARQCDVVGLTSFLSISISDAQSAATKHLPFIVIIDAQMINFDEPNLIDHYFKLKSADGHIVLLNLAPQQSDLPERWKDRIDRTLWQATIESLEATLKTILGLKLPEFRQELIDLREVSAIFVDEAQEMLRDLSELILKLEENSGGTTELDALLRRVHTLKGAAVSLPDAEILATLAHQFESALTHLKAQRLKANSATIDLFLSVSSLFQDLLEYIKQRFIPPLEIIFRVRLQQLRLKQFGNQNYSTDGFSAIATSIISPATQVSDLRDKELRSLTISDSNLDQLTKISADLVIIKNSFQHILNYVENGDDPKLLRRKIQDHSFLIQQISNRLQDQVMTIRQVGLQQIFSKIPGMARQLCHELNKKVSVEIHGESIQVDKNTAAILNGCLSHLVRNAIDHGIELSEERRLKDKMLSGHLTIIASQMDQNLMIRIMDDGKGIDPRKILARALEIGLGSSAELNQLSRDQTINLLFKPGFSTANKITKISGRGIGMDFVKSEIERIGGTVVLETEIDKGTTVIIQTPLKPESLIIENGILIRIEETMLAIPMNAIAEIALIEKGEILKGRNLYHRKSLGKTVPLLQWHNLTESPDHLNRPPPLPNRMATVTLLSQKQPIGVIADGIENQIEMVVYPFNPLIAHPRSLRGTTLLSDDRVAYVIDPDHLSDIARTYDLAEAI